MGQFGQIALKILQHNMTSYYKWFIKINDTVSVCGSSTNKGEIKEIKTDL